jgi:hypothetical protein
LSRRDAKEELGRGSRNNVLIWFRELEHYGFIVEVSPAHHGVNGQGKAPHYRLTEEWHLGKEPTRDFLRHIESTSVTLRHHAEGVPLPRREPWTRQGCERV